VRLYGRILPDSGIEYAVKVTKVCSGLQRLSNPKDNTTRVDAVVIKILDATWHLYACLRAKSLLNKLNKAKKVLSLRSKLGCRWLGL
jgi:hypothetical protein